MENQPETNSNNQQESNNEIQKYEPGSGENVSQKNESVSIPENNITRPETKIEVEKPIRNDLVKVAVQFLQNPKVQKTSLEQRKRFLKSKGLTDLEVDEAIKRSGTPTIINLPPSIPPALNPGYTPQLMIQQPSLFTRIRDGLQSIALLGAIIWGVYIFYKRYVYPLLFNKPKRKSMKEEVEELAKEVKTSTEEIRSTVTQIQNDLTTYNEQRNNSSLLSRQMDELKAEISTVKSLLLSKKQFPTVSSSPVVPPSIPAWQLSNVEHAETVPENDETERDKSDGDKSEEIMELGSGSGSSETEVVTKNSDSSIEIM